MHEMYVFRKLRFLNVTPASITNSNTHRFHTIFIPNPTGVTGFPTAFYYPSMKA